MQRRQPVAKSFAEILTGRVVILGIGNVLRGDDGAGPALVARLQSTCPALCLDGGVAPENYLGRIAKEKPDVVLLIDAAYLEQEPGQFEVLEKDQIAHVGLTTHDISPHLLISYLEQTTQARIYLVAIQPQDLSFGAEISPKIQDALERIVLLLQEALSKET